MKGTEIYNVGLGFKKWIYYNVKATSYENALKKAKKMYMNEKDFVGTGYERNEDFDKVEKIK